MELAFFCIPATAPEPATTELNRFLRSHRILAVQRELVREGQGAYWAVCVEYLAPVRHGETEAGKAGGSGKPKVDYKEVLSAEDFEVFSRLREWRKEVAEREGVPVYAVFTNEQLAAMVTGKVDSLTAMGKIDGIGEARVKKYGNEVLPVLNGAGGKDEASGRTAA